jgi:hypothetical protein
MTHRTQPNQPEEAPTAATLDDLELTVPCPTCPATAGNRCITRAGKPARESHGRRDDALRDAAGITDFRYKHEQELKARGYTVTWGDPKGERALMEAYATRVRPAPQPTSEPVTPTEAAVEPRQNVTPARRQLDHALTAPAATSTTSTLHERLTRRLKAAHLAPLTTTYLDDLTYATARTHTGPGVQARTDLVQEQLLRTLPEPLRGETCTAYARRITAQPDLVRAQHDRAVDHLVQAAQTTGAPAAVALVHILGGAR